MTISRAEALQQRLKYYFTGKPCKQGHLANRYVTSKHCTQCYAVRYDANREQERARDRARYRANPVMAAKRAKTSAVRRAKHNPIPANFDLLTTVPFYAEARRLSSETGIPHHVDHIVPLLEGGMHEASNLRVLAAAENMARFHEVYKRGWVRR